jgi:hypothetical protein
VVDAGKEQMVIRIVENVLLYPLLKFGLVSLVAIPLCFGLSGLIRKLPYVDRAL